MAKMLTDVWDAKQFSVFVISFVSLVFSVASLCGAEWSCTKVYNSYDGRHDIHTSGLFEGCDPYYGCTELKNKRKYIEL